VGGIILVPSLVQFKHITAHSAIASCMFAYIFAGAAGAIIYHQKQSVVWKRATYLCGGSVPGGFLGHCIEEPCCISLHNNNNIFKICCNYCYYLLLFVIFCCC